MMGLRRIAPRPLIHRHATHWDSSDPLGCVTVCGIDCREVRYVTTPDHADDTVTCDECRTPVRDQSHTMAASLNGEGSRID